VISGRAIMSDMMVAWTLLDTRTRSLFRTRVGVDDATWARGRGWALTFGVVALPYYRTTNPTLAAIAQRSLDEVLAGAACGGWPAHPGAVGDAAPGASPI
jgi:aminoglycoside phosphotransferase (APT) family kinase protein